MALFNNNDIPFVAFGSVADTTQQEDMNEFPIVDINNNYLPQPFTHDEDTNGSLFDPDNNLLPPTSEIESMPIQTAIPSMDTCTIDGKVEQSSPLRLMMPTLPLIPQIDADEVLPSPKRPPLACLPLNCNINAPPHTPQKPMDPLDPLTPTANLKILMSAASPEIRNRDNLRRLMDEDMRQQRLALMQRMNEENGDGNQTSRKEKSLGLLCQR